MLKSKGKRKRETAKEGGDGEIAALSRQLILITRVQKQQPAAIRAGTRASAPRDRITGNGESENTRVGEKVLRQPPSSCVVFTG